MSANATAPRPVGRPPEIDAGRRVQVYLDAASLRIAARLGGGNTSAGIRAALAAHNRAANNPKRFT